LLVAVLIAVACAARVTKWHQLEGYSYDKYLEEYNKVYDAKETEYRRRIFEERLERIKAHNNDITKTWKEGVNHMTDWTEQEFSMLLGVKKGALYASKENKKSARNYQPIPQDKLVNIPTNVDWRTAGIITSVKDQGQCGSCWTFGTAEIIESYWAMKTGHLTDLSEQQILDCTPNPDQCGGTGGCQGGTFELAMTRINQMGGLTTEWMYPYVSYYGTNYECHANTTTPVVQVESYVDIPSNQLEPIINHVGAVGPLAVTVDASSWSSYESGVYNGCNQTNPDLDHAVMLVGYGTDPQLGDYWLVRNSWSPLWGEQGYIRLARESSPSCGTDITPSDGTGCKNGPPTVTVCGTCGILYDTVFPVVK